MGKHSKSRAKSKLKRTIRPKSKPQAFDTEERERVRESILQVFRARMHSPDQGSALFSKPANKPSSEARHKIGLEGKPKSPAILIKSPANEHTLSLSRVKRRKTRSERDRLRQRLQGKPESLENQAAGKAEKADFKRHVRRAEEICSSSKVDSALKDKTACAITQSRLTRRLGLFKQGRKSSVVSRELLPVSEAVGASIEQSLHDICNADDSDRPPAVNIDDINVKSICAAKNPKSDKYGSPIPSQCGSLHLTQSPSPIDLRVSEGSRVSAVDAMEVDPSQPASQADSVDSFPSSPALSDIASSLISSINLKQLFPGRDVFEETRHELLQIMRKNAPRDSDVFATPSKTPVSRPGSGCITSAVPSDAVKRRLVESMPPTPPHTGVAASSHSKTENARMKDGTRPIPSSAKNNRSDLTLPLADSPSFAPPPSFNAMFDARNLFRDNDQAASKKLQPKQEPKMSAFLNARQPQGHGSTFNLWDCQDSRSSSRQISDPVGGRLLGKCLDTTESSQHYQPHRSYLCSYGCPAPCTHLAKPRRDPSCDDPWQFHPRCMMGSPVKGAQDITGLEAESEVKHSHQLQSQDMQISKKPSVVTQYVRGEECSSGFHDNYFCQQADRDMNCSRNKPAHHQMDILDYADLGTDTHQMDILDHADPRKDTLATHQVAMPVRQRLPLVRYRSTDSDSSPAWLASLPSLPKKPPIETPSPPGPWLFRRRLY